MQAVCRPCHAHAFLTWGCADGAASPHPGFGVSLPRACCPPPPEMEALTPLPLFLELLAGQAPCPASSPPAGSLPAPCHLLLGPLTRTTSWGAPTGCSDALGCCGQGLGRAPPTFIYCKGKLSIERYIFLSLFLKIYFSAYGLARLPSADREGGHPLPVQWEPRAGAQTWFMPPQFHGVLGGHRQLPPSPICCSVPQFPHQ